MYLTRHWPLYCHGGLSPGRFASWMGGDRDGNPNVTPTITWTVALRSRWQALRLLRKDVRELKMVLSSTSCSDELRKVVGDSREPYRHVMKELEAKIEATISTIDSLFNPGRWGSRRRA